MSGYADTQDPVALLNRTPDTSGGPSVQDAVQSAGIEVQAVDWVWQKVVGESLVKSIIEPITGDFEKIAQQAGQWGNVCDALQAVRNNLNSGLQELEAHWSGDAAQSFKGLIGNTWTVAIEADAQAAKLIGIALNKVAEGSEKACEKALDLIKKLVDKLIEAAAMLPIPVVGWARAVKLVYDGIQMYNAIMELITGIQEIIQGAQQVIDGIKQVGSALSKLKDVRNLNDLINVANDTGHGIATAKGGIDSIKEGAGDVKSGATHAASATAHTVRDARTPTSNNNGSGSGNGDGSGSGTPGGTGSGTPGNGSGNGTPGSRTTPGSGNLRSDTPNPRDRAQPPENRCEGREPIDLATGEMYLTQVDVDLPGVLPLAIGRVHVSSYTSGRLFGASWASTVDQRLEVDRDGVCYADPDGVVLVYPTPSADGTPELPVEGARWPLTRTAAGYAISQPELGRTLEFPAGSGGVAPLGSVTDANGNRIGFDYDTDRVLTTITHSGGYRIDVVSAERKVVELRLAGGPAPVVLVRYGYDDRGRLTEVTNSSGAPLRFDYDDADRITKWTDRNGEWYGYTYDADGRCVATGGSGDVFAGSLAYDRDERVTRETDSLGNVTTHCFNEHNQLIRRIDPLGGETRYEWDRYDRVLSQVDPLGRSTTYTRDEHGNVTTLTRPDGSVITATHDAVGRVLTQTEPDGSVWRRDYDERGNLAATTDPTGAVVRYRYHPNGALAELTDAVGGVQQLATDPAGLPVAITDPAGAVTRYERDQFGRISRIVDPLGATTTLAWTIEGKLLSRTHPDGTAEAWRYDAEGNEQSYVDQAGGVVHTASTHFDLPAARTAQDGSKLVFDYDTELRPVAVTNQQGMVWRYQYDAAGNLVHEVDYDGLQRSYTRDAAGEVVEVAIGEDRIRLRRDALGRVVRREAPTGTSTFSYDHAGRVLTAATADTSTELHRDPCGRIVAETTNGRTVTSTFDAAGRRTARRSGTGAESVWRYDANNRPVELRGGERSLTFGYDQVGRQVQTLADTGHAITQTWDANHRLTSQQLRTSTGDLRQRSYRYRADGYLAAVQAATGGTTFDLDPIGRVRGAQAEGWAEQYAYDPAGNVVGSVLPGTEHPTAGAREYQGTQLRSAGRTRYQYDARGRLVLRQRTRLSHKPDTWHYSWDAEDRLTAVTTPAGERWQYSYDAFGRRTAKQRLTADGQVAERIEFVWDGTMLAEQIGGDGRATVWDHEPNGFRAYAQRDRVPAADAPQEWIDRQFYSIVADGTGTPTELVGTDGAVAWQARRTLWGETAHSGTAEMPLRFPGQYFDAESGLHYNFERYYDPETGRYASTDPLGIAPTANARAYVPNPTRFVDPFGLTPAPGGAHGPGTGSHTNPPPPANNGPISMDHAIDLGARHVGDNGRVGVSGSGGHQFVSVSHDAAGNRVSSVARFDINPASPHVQQYGPHLNLETQVNGRPVRSGPYADPHIPIDPSTIRPGDIP